MQVSPHVSLAGCVWDTSKGPGIVACYIPKHEGGYNLTEPPQQVSDAMKQYKLSRLPQANPFFLLVIISRI